MRKLLIAVCCIPLFAQIAPAPMIRWAATTGNVSLTSSGYTATIQRAATQQATPFLDQIVVYCSVACTVQQAANGTAATTTAGTVAPILPSNLTVAPSTQFFTASNVGSGTNQGGLVNLPAGATQTFCLSQSCNNPAQVSLPVGGNNYSVVIGSLTGTVNITFYGREQ